MRNHKVVLAALVISLFCNLLHAQTLTNSPYSRYGIGDIVVDNIAQSQAMGGIDQAMRYSTWINYNNPASYSALELTTFQSGVKIGTSEQSTSLIKQKVRTGYMTSLAFGIPLKRFWAMSFGLLPYSSVGYRLQNVSTSPIGEEVTYNYTGSGGINRVYLGTAISPFLNKSDSSWLKGFSVGANASYLFGNLNYERRAVFTNASTNYYYNFLNANVYDIGDFYFDYGIQYKTKVSKKWLLLAGATFAPATSIKGKHSGISQNFYSSNGFEYGSDTVDLFTNISGSTKLPARIGGGVTANYSDKLAIGLDYKTQDWSKYEAFGAKDSLTRSNSISLGAQFIPNPSSGRGFWQHVQYRGGVNYVTTNLKIHGIQLAQQSVNIGFGIPIIKSLSTLNISLQYGTRGTTENNLMKEKFYMINVGLSFNDKWFIKRKFD